MAKKEQDGAKFNVIATTSGHVAIQFERQLKELILTSEQAKQLGVGLIEMGTRAEYVQRFGADVHQASQPTRRM